ncbi:MAG: HD domain-containing protein [Terrisporobacter othiniensis]|uniref:HD domain-containing protein n=1 Tax=Terrisporobacter petrolearius TaxID=1460447 RepID=UPI0022E03EA6|nr:HD domain-containing protein [Terrisporobacter petrolearius]MDU4859629.1 HD domain-containing protein [Terrisporobacter othiniensis]MDU6996273.1 HD domain-containing protein [Terrisporobacter othiniensis]
MNLIDIYSKDFPDFIKELINTPEFKRLSNVGMNCGCEYTSFPIFSNGKDYTRYEHSIGVALIIWHFTKDIKQSIAGLLHDISSPVFAHVIDFLNGDHETQESTEEKTEEIIANSMEIQEILKKYNLSTKDVYDYHMYPIADNDSPLLSADRLEYTLGNAFYYGFKSMEEIRDMYEDLAVSVNEFGQSEISFSTLDKAIEFTCVSIENSKVYSSNVDRFAMQYLADLLKLAVNKRVISMKDLYTVEDQVISKLKKDEELKSMWKDFTKLSQIFTSKEKPEYGYWVNIPAKKRYINPQVVSQGRVSSLSKNLSKEIDNFLNIDFNIWLSGK